jgi:hypothetical protein
MMCNRCGLVVTAQNSESVVVQNVSREEIQFCLDCADIIKAYNARIFDKAYRIKTEDQELYDGS